MTSTLADVIGAIAVLYLSIALKAWSTFALWDRYKPHEYWADKKARRLFLIGRITPLTALLAIVALAYTTHIWWLELPAWLFVALLTYGVVTRINQAKRHAGD
jgi:hypothetical protein